MAMILRITKAGRQALVNSQGNGTAQTRIVSMGVTAQSFAFDEDMTVLPAEIKRVTELGGKALDGSQISLSVTDQSTDTYEIRGFGLYFEDGTLFAVYSQAALILEKSEAVPYIFQFDISITDAEIDATQITFGEMVFYNPPATETIVGVARIATLEEVLAGNLANNVFITPETLEQVLLLRGYPIGVYVLAAFDSPPPGATRCNGALLPLPEYNLFFEKVGTRYGGDGITTVGVPDVRGDFPRFWDDSRGVDIGRELGTHQDAEFSHQHVTPVNDTGSYNNPQIARGDQWTPGKAVIGIPSAITANGGTWGGSGEDSWLLTTDVYSNSAGPIHPENFSIAAYIMTHIPRSV